MGHQTTSILLEQEKVKTSFSLSKQRYACDYCACPKTFLPLTKNLALGLRGDTDIGAVGELVGDEGHPSNSSSAQNKNDGVSRDVRKPSLGERLAFLHLTGNSGQIHAARSESHVGSTGRSKERCALDRTPIWLELKEIHTSPFRRRPNKFRRFTLSTAKLLGNTGTPECWTANGLQENQAFHSTRRCLQARHWDHHQLTEEERYEPKRSWYLLFLFLGKIGFLWNTRFSKIVSTADDSEFSRSVPHESANGSVVVPSVRSLKYKFGWPPEYWCNKQH